MAWYIFRVEFGAFVIDFTVVFACRSFYFFWNKTILARKKWVKKGVCQANHPLIIFSLPQIGFEQQLFSVNMCWQPADSGVHLYPAHSDFGHTNSAFPLTSVQRQWFIQIGRSSSGAFSLIEYDLPFRWHFFVSNFVRSGQSKLKTDQSWKKVIEKLIRMHPYRSKQHPRSSFLPTHPNSSYNFGMGGHTSHSSFLQYPTKITLANTIKIFMFQNVKEIIFNKFWATT